MSIRAGFVLWIAVLATPVCVAGSRQTIAEWNNRGAAAYSRGEWAKAEQLLNAAREGAKDSTDALARASIEFNLGALTRTLARYGEAEQHYRAALQFREGVLGSIDGSLAPLLRGLSLTLLAKGDLAGAEDLGARAVRLVEHAGGREWGWALSDFARVQLGRCEWDGAAASAELALAALREQDSGYAELLTTLGVIARHRHRLEEAERYAEWAGKLLANSLGERHPSTAAAWNNLAQVKLAQRKPDEAMELLKRATAAWIDALGPQHPNVAIGLANQGQLALSRTRGAEAEGLFARALAIDLRVYGERGTRVAMDWNNLGSLAMKRRRFREAAGFYERALTSAIEEEDRGLVAGNLAVAYCRQKRWNEAAGMLTEAVRVRERQYGADDVQLGSLLDWQALALRNIQDFSGAAQVELRATRIRVKQALLN